MSDIFSSTQSVAGANMSIDTPTVERPARYTLPAHQITGTNIMNVQPCCPWVSRLLSVDGLPHPRANPHWCVALCCDVATSMLRRFTYI